MQNNDKSPPEKVVKPTIVVVDDNQNDLIMTKFLIQREGCEHKLIDNQMELLPYLKNNPAILILLDVEMPGLSGIDMLKRLKREPKIKDIPVIMLTGNSALETVKTCLSLGASDYMVKPIDPMVFEAKIQKILQGSSEGHKKQWVEYQLEQLQQTTVKLQLPGIIISLGELSFTVQVPYSVSEGATFFMETSLFQDMGIKDVPLKVESCKEVGDVFHLKCFVLGLSDADLQKIRIFCKTLWKINAR